MSNPGPAVTNTSTETQTPKSSGGYQVGQSALDMIGFYGATPVAQASSGVDLITQLIGMGLVPAGTALEGSGQAPIFLTTGLALTAALHAGRTLVLNSAVGAAFTLPAATGSGNKYSFKVGTTITSVGTTITTGVTGASSDAFQGYILTEDAGAMTGWPATPGAGGSDVITLNGTTKGGFAGDYISLVDVAAGQWQIEGVTKSSGTAATPFSHA